ncbi:MAG: ATP-binding cassette domain-containing protein [Actinomycetota bacterium]
MAPGVVVAARDLTKTYGRTRGVVELTFEVEPGEVFGYLGPNGAGKTTTIRTMLDFISPTSGRIEVFGLDSRKDSVEIHRRVGYLPGELALYDRMTGAEYLAHFASLRGGVDESFVAELVERLELDTTVRIRSLSHGNRQKVGLVQAFMHRPELLVLDEPTQGLDPLVQQEFYGLVEEARARGATVFMSSHVMPEVERVCDRVAIIREGRLVTVDDVGDLKAKAVRRIELHFDRPVAPDAFTSLASVTSVEARGDSLLLTIRGPVDEVVKEAARHTVVNVATHEPSLEEIFLDVYRNGGDR